MYDVRKRQICSVNHDAGLLERFSGDRLSGRLITIEMSRNDAILPVLVPRVVSPEQQNSAIEHQEKMRVRDEIESLCCHRSLPCMAMISAHRAR